MLGHQRANFERAPTRSQRHPCARPANGTAVHVRVARSRERLVARTPHVTLRCVPLLPMLPPLLLLLRFPRLLAVALHRSQGRVRNRTTPCNHFCGRSLVRACRAACNVSACSTGGDICLRPTFSVAFVGCRGATFF